jgi:carbamoyl-phosphate synthase large subunit
VVSAIATHSPIIGSRPASRPNVLISSGGRRVALANCFRQSLEQRGSAGWVAAIDSGATAPLSFCADRAWRVPQCAAPQFIETVLNLAIRNQIGLIIPTIDPELPVYARNRERFAAQGITIAVSDPRTIAIAANKKRTNAWLVENGFPTVRQGTVLDVLESPSDWAFPLIAKPGNGSASIGLRKVASPAELEPLAVANASYVVEEIAPGREFTVNVYVDRFGSCIAAVPHWRVEVRGGEVSKGLTVRDSALIDLAYRIAERLPGAYGALNIQGFANGSDELRIIEINARFGGGYPLAHHAGARFTDWLMDEVQGTQLTRYEDWTDDLAMLRYDEAVFVPGARIRA